MYGNQGTNATTEVRSGSSTVCQSNLNAKQIRVLRKIDLALTVIEVQAQFENYK